MSEHKIGKATWIIDLKCVLFVVTKKIGHLESKLSISCVHLL